MEQFLKTLNHINITGNARGDRTGTGTMSLFGEQMRFNLQEGFPLVTTKQVFSRGLIEELIWMVLGQTNNNLLWDKNVHIWDEWATKDIAQLPVYTVEERYDLLRQKLGEEEFSKIRYMANPLEADEETRHALLDKFGIPRYLRGPKDGDLGPIYGAQWRHWKTYEKHEVLHERTAGELIDALVKLPNPRMDLVQLIVQDLGQPRTDLDATELSYPTRVAVEEAVELYEIRPEIRENEIDQLAELIENLKKNPYSRRHVISAWNVADLGKDGPAGPNVERGKMALSPCHALFQFYVRDRKIEDIRADMGEDLWEEFTAWQKTLQAGKDYQGSIVNVDYSKLCFKWLNEHGIRTYELDCQLYQRSADMFLGVPFNIASYALLTMMIAQVTGTMVPGEFIWTGGDCHIYSNHFDQVDTQLSREPKPLPKMVLDPTVKNINDFRIEHFTLTGYDPHPPIKGDVAV